MLQSLVDIAREEAERRKLLEQQGIEAKVIIGNGVSLPAEWERHNVHRPSHYAGESIRAIRRSKGPGIRWTLSNRSQKAGPGNSADGRTFGIPAGPLSG